MDVACILMVVVIASGFLGEGVDDGDMADGTAAFDVAEMSTPGNAVGMLTEGVLSV